jgi:outer membrane protein
MPLRFEKLSARRRRLVWVLIACISVINLSGDAAEASEPSGRELGAMSGPKHLIKIGAYRFFVRDDADDLDGPFTPPFASADVNDTTSFALSYSRFLSDHLSVQFAMGYPPKFTVDGAGTISALGEIVTFATINPTVFFNYHFLEPSARIRPYVGIGVNYTNFIDEDPSTTLALGLGGPTSISLSSFVAIAATAGVDIQLHGPWIASVSLNYLRSDTTATITTGGIERTMDIDVDPLTLFVGIGYQF